VSAGAASPRGQAARAAARGSLVVQLLAAATRQVVGIMRAIGPRAAIALEWALTPTPSNELFVDQRRLRTLLADGWIVRHASAAGLRISRWWQRSATAGFLTNLGADIDALPAGERVRAVGLGLVAALVTHGALTRFELLVTRSPWLAGWVAVMLLAAALLRYPSAIAAAWANRHRPTWTR